MATAGDPLQSGVVASLARPGGNVTGVTLYGFELTRKRLEVFKEVAPDIVRVAVLSNASNPYNASLWQETQRAAPALGIAPELFNVKELDELTAAFSNLAGDGANALVVLSDARFNQARREICSLAAQHQLPAIYEGREFAEAGGLMSHGPNIAEMTRRSAVLIDKVLRGARPADLPIEQPTKFELVINLKTAKTLGLTIPPLIMELLSFRPSLPYRIGRGRNRCGDYCYLRLTIMGTTPVRHRAAPASPRHRDIQDARLADSATGKTFALLGLPFRVSSSHTTVHRNSIQIREFK
jgi:ABC-type uncharacterized transport system substrate-binding protein